METIDPLLTIRRRINAAANGNLQTITMAAARVGLMIPCDTVEQYEAVLKEIKRRKEVRVEPVSVELQAAAQPQAIPHDVKERYRAAHEENFSREYPAAYKDGHYSPPVMPKVNTSNGLTTFIVNFLSWRGHRATRINVSGRLIETPEKQASGVILGTKKYMHSRTRKGTADISSTVHGRSIQWEVKTGRDKPSPAQIEEQRRERRAGGEYFFTHTAEEFLTLYDSLLYG